MNLFRANLVYGIGFCILYACLAIGGIKSPFGSILKEFGSSSTGGPRGSGFYYFGGGK